MGCYAPVICKALAAIVGEDENAYIFNNPYENRGVISCPKDIIVNRYYVYHSQAVALKPVPCAKG